MEGSNLLESLMDWLAEILGSERCRPSTYIACL